MKGNRKVLDNEGIRAYKNKYNFQLRESDIVVSTIGRDGSRKTIIHEFGKAFTTSLRDKNGQYSQSLLITPNAQNIWKENFLDENLGEIQNSINVLCVSNIPVTTENIEHLLESNR